MADSLIVIDPDGKINNVNDANIDLLGYEEKELMGKTIDKIAEPIKASKGSGEKNGRVGDMMLGVLSNEEIKELIQNDFISDCEISYITIDNRKIPMSFRGSVIKNDEGEVQGIV
ncbi:MAG: PAS domain-containing protein [Bacteroidetes bacterium]|nr:PAS domain-containing protein [Bacteroidota bacterium]